MIRIRFMAATALALAMTLAGTVLAQGTPGTGGSGGAGMRPTDTGAQSGAMQQRGTVQQDMARDRDQDRDQLHDQQAAARPGS